MLRLARYFSVLIYHGPDRKKLKVKHLQKYDVVLTTYSTLVLDFPDDEGEQKKARAKAKKNGGEEEDYFEFQTKGPLLKMSWYRIILDEARESISLRDALLGAKLIRELSRCRKRSQPSDKNVSRRCWR